MKVKIPWQEGTAAQHGHNTIEVPRAAVKIRDCTHCTVPAPAPGRVHSDAGHNILFLDTAKFNVGI